jgi:hypothetical protein
VFLQQRNYPNGHTKEDRYHAALWFAANPPLGYILDIWAKSGKVLSLHWSSVGELEIVSFKRGNWEDAIIGGDPERLS